MKNIIVLLGMTCMSLFVSAQSKTQKKLAAAVEQLTAAMINGDSAALDQLTAPQLSYGHSGGSVDTKPVFLHKFASGQSDFVSINITDQTITISKKLAIVRHRLDAVTNDNGKPGEAHLKVLLVWQLSGRHWKLIARQAVKV